MVGVMIPTKEQKQLQKEDRWRRSKREERKRVIAVK